MSGYTVYKHTCPNGKIYIGITKRNVEKRWLNGKGYERQPHFYNAILKYGWDNIDHEILFENLTKEEACEKEVEMIAYYKSHGRRYGYNDTIGGECLEGENNPFYGKTHSEETRKKLSLASKGRHLSEETKMKIVAANKGKKRTKEFCEWMRQINLDRDRSSYASREIYQIDADTNEIIKKWDSIIQAAEFYNTSYVNICYVCKGKTRTAKGFKWQYIDEPHEFIPGKANKVEVVQLSLDDEFIAKYESSKDAEKLTGCNSSTIIKCCKNKKKTCKGFKWMYYKDYLEKFGGDNIG